MWLGAEYGGAHGRGDRRGSASPRGHGKVDMSAGAAVPGVAPEDAGVPEPVPVAETAAVAWRHAACAVDALGG